MTREELIILISRMNSRDEDSLRTILQCTESEQGTGTENISELGFDIERTIIVDNPDPVYF